MEKHLTIVALINITFGIILFCVGILLFVLIAGGGMLSGDIEAIFITGSIGSAFGLFFTILAIPEILGGIGLLQKKNWGRIIILIVSIIDLINIPIGTAIGVYSIWVLMSDKTIMLMD